MMLDFANLYRFSIKEWPLGTLFAFTMITDHSIATLVIFIISIILVIFPVYIPLRLPCLGLIRIPINLTTAPVFSIAVLWAAQCLGLSTIKDGIVGTDSVKPYNILCLFFSLAYMAITLDITGVLQAAAFWVNNKGGSHGYKLYLYFYLLLTALSVFLGNDSVILSGTAFLVYFTKLNELNPAAWLISEFAAANTASMVLFVGNPTNVVICEGFSVGNMAFTAYTTLPFLGCSVVCLAMLGIQFRKSKYIRRHLPVAEDLDVMSVFLDPIGACVGGALLGMCLIVVLVSGFFHIDAWKIILPFAVAKFTYDIAWDHYTRVRNVAILGQTPKHENSNGTIDIENAISRETMDTADPNGAGPQRLAETIHDNTATTTARDNQLDVTLFNDVYNTPSLKSIIIHSRLRYIEIYIKLKTQFPTLFTALPRLPFALVPFAFCQFILIEALAHQGWIELFSIWLVNATGRQMHAVIWLVGILGVLLCNVAGTNIGATILLTKVVRAAALDHHGNRAAAIALAVATNIGAVNFTYSASLAGLLWKHILEQKGVHIKQRTFARWNMLPLVMMTIVGLAIVSAEMAIMHPSNV